MIKYATRTKNLNVRLKENEFHKLELKASEKNMSVSEFVREIIFEDKLLKVK
jgi:predicted DNA binding CopG/RHH family protein